MHWYVGAVALNGRVLRPPERIKYIGSGRAGRNGAEREAEIRNARAREMDLRVRYDAVSREE